jgi:protein-S-isoprenylcysteine O-methyltransferase Ste14
MNGFDIFQVAALAIFLTLFVGRTLGLRLKDRINPIVLGAGKSGARRAAELVVPVGFAFWVAEVANHALGPRALWLPVGAYEALFDATAAKVTGVVLIVVGLALFAAALVSFGKSWRVGVDELHPGDLVSGGVFAVSRNPIFVFMILYAVGGASSMEHRSFSRSPRSLPPASTSRFSRRSAFSRAGMGIRTRSTGRGLGDT